MFLTLAFACGKEDIATESAIRTVTERTDEPAGCRCEIRVDPASPANNIWSLSDQYGILFSGAGNNSVNGGVSTPLPTPFVTIPTGWNYFDAQFNPTSGAINTTVRCFDVDSAGNETLATTTTHIFSSSTAYNEIGPGRHEFCKRFECLDIEITEDETGNQCFATPF